MGLSVAGLHHSGWIVQTYLQSWFVARKSEMNSQGGRCPSEFHAPDWHTSVIFILRKCVCVCVQAGPVINIMSGQRGDGVCLSLSPLATLVCLGHHVSLVVEVWSQHLRSRQAGAHVPEWLAVAPLRVKSLIHPVTSSRESTQLLSEIIWACPLLLPG